MTRTSGLPTAAVIAVAALALATGGCSDDAGEAPASTAERPQSRPVGPVNPPDEGVSVMTADFQLAEEAQKYLWETEHLAFVFGQDVASKVADAIRGDDDGALGKFLSADFEARLFRGDGAALDHDGLVRVVDWADGDATAAVGRDGFTAALAALGDKFTELDAVRMHVSGLSPVVHRKMDGPWTAVFDIQLIGLTRSGGRASYSFWAEAGLDSLVEEMAEKTGFINSFRQTSARWVASDRALMREITDDTGIDTDEMWDNWEVEPPFPAIPGMAHLLDYDRDGLTDLLVTENAFDGRRRLYLYRGTGDGKFEDVTDAAQLGFANQLPRGTSLVVSLVADFDDDGWEDLLLGIKMFRQGPPKHGIAFARNRAGKFEKVNTDGSLNYPLRTNALGAGIADYDGDGLLDIYLGAVGEAAEVESDRWFGDTTHGTGVLVRNLGGFLFEEVTRKAELTGEYVDSFVASWLDVEPDGDADLFLGNHLGRNVMWINDGDGTFSKRAQPPGFGGFTMGADTGDLDGDGKPDIYIANMYSSAGSRIMGNLRAADYPDGAFAIIQGFITGNELYVNDGTGAMAALGVEARVANAGWAYGPGVVDLDGDGDLDLYSPAGYQSVERGKPDG